MVVISAVDFALTDANNAFFCAATSNMSQSFRCSLASQCLHAGELIAYPTEAVWGLGCDPFNGAAVERLLHLKSRAIDKGLILVAANFEQLRPYLAELDEASQRLLAASWPGPNTWLIPHNGTVPFWVSGGRPTVAVRVSAHPLVRELSQCFGGPLVSTSANRSGASPAKTATAVRRYFGKEVDYILAGQLGSLSSPTTIRDLLTSEILR